MELKDVILSTLAEMEDESLVEPTVTPQETPEIKDEIELSEPTYDDYADKQIDSELAYLNSIRERLLVLFEGFQAPNNANIEAKVDMTLNFLEYTLATIDLRVQTLEKGDSK